MGTSVAAAKSFCCVDRLEMGAMLHSTRHCWWDRYSEPLLYQQAARAAAAPGAAAVVIDPSDAEVAEAAVEAGAAVEDTAVAVEAPHAAFTAEERELLASAAACGCSSADLLDCVVCGPAYHLQGYVAHMAEVAATEGSRGSRAAEPQVMSDGTMPGLEPSLPRTAAPSAAGWV
jgi:hypothetical protein